MTIGERLGHLTARRPAAVLVAALLLAVLAGLLVTRLHADTGVANLFPAGDPATSALSRWLADFPTGGDVLVLATLPEDAAAGDGPLLAFGDRLSSALAGAPDVSAVVYRLDAPAHQFVERVVGPAAVYYLSDAGYADAKRRLTRPAMVAQLHQDEAMLAAPGPAATALASATMVDPLHLHESLVGAMATRLPGGGGGGGAVLSRDGRSILVRVITRAALGDVAADRRLVERVTAAATAANPSGLRIEISGGPAIAAFDAGTIRHDCTVSIASSIVLLQLLFAVAYRRPIRSFALAFVPVGLGVLYGFGLRALFGGSIAPTAAVVGAVLAGMGIDYTVLYLPHYASARADGLSAADAVRRTTAGLLAPVTAACATSLFGFVAVGWSSVPALRDFAVVGALGLAGSLAAAVTVLPAALVLMDGGGGTAEPRASVGPVLAWGSGHRRLLVRGWAVVLVAALVVIVVTPGRLLQLTTDLRAMHPQPNPPLAAAADIAARMGADPGSMSVYLHAKTPDELVRLAYAVDRRLATPAVRRAGVAGTIGLSSLLPDPAVVAARRLALSTAAADATVADFRAAVAETSFDPAAFANYERFLQRMLLGPPAPTVNDLSAYPRLAESTLSRDELAGRWRTGDCEAVTLLLVDRPLALRADREAAVSTVRVALADVPGATLTGLGVAGLAAEATVTRDLPKLLLAAVAMNGLYLLAHFRSYRSAAWALLPAAVSLAVTAAVARAAHLELNLINLVAVPLLIGIDVDYGIYLVSLARGKGAARRVGLSGHSVAVSAASNVLGFASLVTTSVPAVRSLGWVVAVGVAACLAATLLWLAPALIRPQQETT